MPATPNATTAAVRATAARVRWMLLATTATLAVVVAQSAWAQAPAGDRPVRAIDAMHGGMGDHGGRGFGMLRGGGSPERMARMIDRMLDGLNASDAQRTQIKQIAAAAAADLRNQTSAGRALRERGAQALLGPNVDAATAEQVRQQMLQQHDQMSRRTSQAMVDIARILTPEQRARLAERFRDMQQRMEDRRRRMEQRSPR